MVVQVVTEGLDVVDGDFLLLAGDVRGEENEGDETLVFANTETRDTLEL